MNERFDLKSVKIFHEDIIFCSMITACKKTPCSVRNSIIPKLGHCIEDRACIPLSGLAAEIPT